MKIGLWQCLDLLMQGVDKGAVALDLLLYLPLLASQSLGRELVMTHLLTRHLSERLRDPRLHVISICLELMQGHRVLEPLLSEL